MSSLRDRNPSPPTEILENDEVFVPDRIGDTMYSKQWLYKTLQEMLEVVREHNDVEKETEDSVLVSVGKESEESSSESENDDPKDENIVELDKNVEEYACTLWDMSANSAIAEFLCESGVADIFLTIMKDTKSPRLLEIVVGILGNMSSFDSSCRYISTDSDLMKSVIMLSGCSDSCTLVQVFRLLNCAVANVSYCLKWYVAFEKEHSTFMRNLKNILENNLCHDVLQGVLQFLDRILSYSSNYHTIWTQDSYFMAIIESGKQLLKCNQYEDLDSFWSVLWTIDKNSNGSLCLPVYVNHFLDLKPLFEAYILKIGEEETLPQAERLDCIGHTFVLFGNFLTEKNIKTKHIKLENDVFKAIVHIYRLLDSFLKKHMKNIECDLPGEETVNTVTTIIQPEEKDGVYSSLEAEEFADLVLIAETAYKSIVYCAHACSYNLKGAEGLLILEDIIDINSPLTPESIRNIGKQ